MAAPNGISASFASLKCCMPKGIPIIVMKKTPPITRCSIANGIPDTSSQITFRKREPAPPPYCTSFPNGKKLSCANLKHCIPTGIPMIVMHQRHPARHQLNPVNAPPNTNHNKFPKHPIFFPPEIIFPLLLKSSAKYADLSDALHTYNPFSVRTLRWPFSSMFPCSLMPLYDKMGVFYIPVCLILIRYKKRLLS